MVVTAMFATGAVVTYGQRGWTWVSVGMALATIFIGLGSIVESFLLRIELTDDALIATDLTGRKRYPIADIEGVEDGKGGPPAIKLTSGRWAKLPSVGSNVGNSVRSWLKQSRP